MASLDAHLVGAARRFLSHCGMGFKRPMLVAGRILNRLGMPGEHVVQIDTRSLATGRDGGIQRLSSSEGNMPKYYIIPIDTQGHAYLGRKAATNPYNQQPLQWCRSAPNVFGGNQVVNVDHTLKKEASEESWNKIELVDLHTKVLVHTALLQNNVQMNFYAIRGFAWNPAAPIPNPLENEHRECTGEVFTVDLTTLPHANDVAARLQVRQSFTAQCQGPHYDAGITHFEESEGMVALRSAAQLVQAGLI